MSGLRAVSNVPVGLSRCPSLHVETCHCCGKVDLDADLISHRVPEAQVQALRKTGMVEVLAEVLRLKISTLSRYQTLSAAFQVGMWQAVLGYTLASSCGLLWCIEGVVNSALHGEGLSRSSKFSRCES